MPVFSTTQPSLKVRILPKFPANVLAGTGIVITRSGGRYVFSTAALADVPLSALADQPEGTLVGRDTGNGAGPPSPMSVGGGLVFTGAGGVQLSDNQRARSVQLLFPALAAGQQQDIQVPLTCVISKVTLLANAAGSCVVDIWKTPFTGYPPTIANTITAAAKPTLSGAVKLEQVAFPGWTVAITAGDTLRFNIDSASGIARLLIAVQVVTA